MGQTRLAGEIYTSVDHGHDPLSQQKKVEAHQTLVQSRESCQYTELDSDMRFGR